MKEYKTSCPELEIRYKSGEHKKAQIKTSADAAAFFRKIFDEDTIEYLETVMVIYLNHANNTIGWFNASQGGITGTVADPRVILGTALKCGATRFMLAHNHPSGSAKPSVADERLTEKLKQGGAIVDIQLIDHLIILPDGGYYSFADDGRI